jgi:hypothetical protein
MTTQARKLLIIFGILLVLTAFLILKTNNKDSLMPEDGGYSSDTETTQEIEGIFSNVQKTRDIKPDVDLFSDSKFKSLKDFTVNIADVRTGRPNPFEPVVD